MSFLFPDLFQWCFCPHWDLSFTKFTEKTGQISALYSPPQRCASSNSSRDRGVLSAAWKDLQLWPIMPFCVNDSGIWTNLHRWGGCTCTALSLTEPPTLLLTNTRSWTASASTPFQIEGTSSAAQNGIPVNAEAVIWSNHQSASFSWAAHL